VLNKPDSNKITFFDAAFFQLFQQ